MCPGPVAKFLVLDWGNTVDSDIGMSYRPARLYRLAGRYYIARVDYIPQSGTKIWPLDRNQSKYKISPSPPPPGSGHIVQGRDVRGTRKKWERKPQTKYSGTHYLAGTHRSIISPVKYPQLYLPFLSQVADY
jgi:hypothetical protein